MAPITGVQLNEQESALYESICWDQTMLLTKPHGERVIAIENMGQLADLLLDRKAIPQVRLSYFTDPDMNVGGHGKSRKQVFENNGTTGKNILKHPNFIEYLRYFIKGPDLPEPTIRGFCKIIEDDAGTSGMVLDQIRAYVRKEVRAKRLEPSKAADEFFKLAHEIGKPSIAESVRSAVRY